MKEANEKTFRRRGGAAFALLLIGACGVSGCGQGVGAKTNSIPAAHDSEMPADASWKLVYAARCGDAAASQCRGAYGLSLLNDGRYVVGPGPKQELLTGRLEHQDFEALRAHLARLNLSGFSAPGRCEAPAQGQGVSLRLEFHGRSRTLFSDSPEKPCFDRSLLAGEDGARDLETWVAALLEKYYPDTFPNPCVEAASALAQSYSGLQACEQDSDCTYLDENFLPIESQDRRVVVDDCSYLQPLAVANEFLAVTSQRELVLQRDLVRRICAQTPRKPSCSRLLSFDPEVGPAVCREGRCEMNPQVEKGY